MPVAKGRFRLAGMVVATALFLAVAPGTAWAGDAEQVGLAARQLLGSQLPSGLLDFDFDFLAGSGQGSGERDAQKIAFIARQAHAAYILAKYHAWSHDGTVAAPLGRFLETLGSLSLPIGKSRPQQWIEATHILSTPFLRYTLRSVLDGLNLLYRPEGNGKLVAYEGDYKFAWAGTTALALLAELNFFQATGDNRFADLRASWLAGMMTLHIPARGSREYPASIEEAPYSDGETWLALATYTVAIPEDRAVAGVVREYDDYLMRRYSGTPGQQFYAWGTAAAAMRFAATSDQRFLDFVEAQTRYVLDEPELNSERDDNSCGFVEGLAIAASLFSARQDREAAFVAALAKRIDREMAKNRALQIQPGQERLDLTDGAYLQSPRLASYAGAFLAGVYSPAIRIDITGHCIAALIEMQGSRGFR